MARAAGSQAVALDMYITEKFKRPSPTVPDLRGFSPQNAAEAVRAQWGLGYRPIPNLVHLLEKNGVRVYSLVHEGGEIDGFSTWRGNFPFIFLNITKTAERSRMDAAHELAHLVLHHYLRGPAGRAEEEEARLFASCFLMPGPAFIATAPRRITLPAILDAKRQWGVSALRARGDYGAGVIPGLGKGSSQRGSRYKPEGDGKASSHPTGGPRSK
jgi:hypothetical protein